MNSSEFHDLFAQRAERVGLSVPLELVKQLETYLRLLATWDRKINLTGADLTVPSAEALDRLLIEPLIAARHVPVEATSLIDIGSGGGSPALPLVLAVPRLSVVMVESKLRKSVFLREAGRALGLTRAAVATGRLEALVCRPEHRERYDLLTVRAVRIGTDVLSQLRKLVRPSGHLFLFRSEGESFSETLPPSLCRLGTFPLIESLKSQLVVLGR